MADVSSNWLVGRPARAARVRLIQLASIAHCGLSHACASEEVVGKSSRIREDLLVHDLDERHVRQRRAMIKSESNRPYQERRPRARQRDKSPNHGDITRPGSVILIHCRREQSPCYTPTKRQHREGGGQPIGASLSWLLVARSSDATVRHDPVS